MVEGRVRTRYETRFDKAGRPYTAMIDYDPDTGKIISTRFRAGAVTPSALYGPELPTPIPGRPRYRPRPPTKVVEEVRKDEELIKRKEIIERELPPRVEEYDPETGRYVIVTPMEREIIEARPGVEVVEEVPRELTAEERAREAVEVGAEAYLTGLGARGISAISPRAAMAVRAAGIGLSGIVLGIAGVGLMQKVGISKNLEGTGREINRFLGDTGDVMKVVLAPKWARIKPIGEYLETQGKGLIHTVETQPELLAAGIIGGYAGWKTGGKLGAAIKSSDIKVTKGLKKGLRTITKALEKRRPMLIEDVPMIGEMGGTKTVAGRMPARGLEVKLNKLADYFSSRVARAELKLKPYYSRARLIQIQQFEQDYGIGTRGIMGPLARFGETFDVGATATIRQMVHPKVSDIGAAAGLAALRTTRQETKQITKLGVKTAQRLETVMETKQLQKTVTKPAYKVAITPKIEMRLRRVITPTVVAPPKVTPVVEPKIPAIPKIPEPKIPKMPSPHLLFPPLAIPGIKPRRRRRVVPRPRGLYVPSLVGIAAPVFIPRPLKIITGLEPRYRIRRKKKKKKKRR